VTFLQWFKLERFGRGVMFVKFISFESIGWVGGELLIRAGFSFTHGVFLQ